MADLPMLFRPLSLRGLHLKNRVVMSPMCQYQAGEDGLATAWHRIHYGARAVGGAALLIVEATGVRPEGRITTGDLGLWEDRQVEPLADLVAFAHAQGAAIGIQLAHAGRKAELPAPVAPSPLPFAQGRPVPRPLALEEVALLPEVFQGATRRALAAGFDFVEVHAAHGYLLHEFLSPLTNHRDDRYGGDPAGRSRLLFEVLEAVRAELPQSMPLGLRISASDYREGGLYPAEWHPLLPRIRQAGVDLLDVSSGGLLPEPPPAVYPGYQLPFARELAEEGLLRMAVGMLDDFALAESALRRGDADLIAIGRGLLRDPYWPLRTARQAGVAMPPPRSYERAF